jgi:hypothetical protein
LKISEAMRPRMASLIALGCLFAPLIGALDEAGPAATSSSHYQVVNVTPVGAGLVAL